mgnify:FL=1
MLKMYNILVITTYDYESLYSLYYVINEHKRKVISYDFYAEYDKDNNEYYKLVVKGIFDNDSIALWKRYVDNFKNNNLINFFVL